MKIRMAEEEDLDGLVALWYESSCSAHDFIAPAYWEQNRGVMRGLYLPLSTNLVIDDGAGFISMMGSEINALFIKPDHVNKGLGSALINTAKELEEELSLSVYVKNQQAVQFYLKHGFTIVSTDVDEAVSEQQYHMEWRKQEQD